MFEALFGQVRELGDSLLEREKFNISGHIPSCCRLC